MWNIESEPGGIWSCYWNIVQAKKNAAMYFWSNADLWNHSKKSQRERKKKTKSLKKGCREFVSTFREAILNCLTCHYLFEIHSSSLCASVHECACACVRVQITVDVSGQVLSVKVLSTSTT